MTTTTDLSAAIARLEEDDLLSVMRSVEERLTALGQDSIAGYLSDASTDLRFLVDRQAELERESEFNRTWSSATVARKCGLEWALVGK